MLQTRSDTLPAAAIAMFLKCVEGESRFQAFTSKNLSIFLLQLARFRLTKCVARSLCSLCCLHWRRHLLGTWARASPNSQFPLIYFFSSLWICIKSDSNLVRFSPNIFSARCNIYISRLCYDVSVLSLIHISEPTRPY